MDRILLVTRNQSKHPDRGCAKASHDGRISGRGELDRASPKKMCEKFWTLSHFEDYGPRMVLLTDITYLSYNGTFAYLSTILDAFTKQILSYVLSPSLAVDFVLETVSQLMRDHGLSIMA